MVIKLTGELARTTMHFPLLFATAFFAGDVLAARIILSPVDDYINKQYPLSKKLLLGNIGQPVGAAVRIIHRNIPMPALSTSYSLV